MAYLDGIIWRVFDHSLSRHYRREYGRNDDAGGADHVAVNHASVDGSAGLSAFL